MWQRLRRKRKLTCPQARAKLLAYLDGELPTGYQEAVREHLATCVACARYAREVEAVEADLRAGAGRYRPRLTPQAAARIQERVYRRMRRGLIMQRATQFSARAAGIVAALVLAVGLAALWTGRLPGAEKNSDPEQTAVPDKISVITFACYDYEHEQYETLIQNFEEVNPDIRVQLISLDEAAGIQREGSIGISDGQEISRLAAAADTFFWYFSPRSDDWTYLLDLEPFVNDPSFPSDDFYPGVLDQFRWQGALHGLPADVTPILIFYDKKLFDAAGLPRPHIGWTWDDFTQAALKLTEREGDTVTRYGFVDNGIAATVHAMLHQHGVHLWDERSDPPQPLFDTPQVAQVLRRYTDLALGSQVMPVPERNSNVMAYSLINEGKAAMWPDSALNFDYYASKMDLGMVPFPEDVNAANPHSLAGFFASAGTAHPKAAWRWLSYLSANYQPFLSGTLAGRRSVAEQATWWNQLDQETKAIFEHALAHPSPPDSALNRPLLWAVLDVFENGTDVEQALATAQAQALELQAEAAQARPAAPQPVATPQPKPADTERQTVITFAPYMSTELSLYKKLAASFHASHPDLWVEIIPPSDLEVAVTSDCFGGMYPIQSAEVRQNIRSLQPFLDAGDGFDLGDYYAPLLEAQQQDGELWALPYAADALMVYANLERFAEAGLAPPEPGWSFEDFMAAAETLSGPGQYGFTSREGAYGDLIFVLERLGARLFDASHEPPTPTFDDPTVVAALERYAKAYRAVALTPATPSTRSGWPNSIKVTTGEHLPGVESGQVAMWLDYISYHAWGWPLSFDVGVAPLPVGTQASTEFRIYAYYISSHTPNAQACWDWLSFLSTQPETVVQQLPARRSVLASSSWQERTAEAALPAYQATLEYADTSLFYLRWDQPWLGYAYPWLDAAFQATVGGAEAGTSLVEAQARAEALVACLEAAEGFYDHAQLQACARLADADYPLAGSRE